MRKKRSKRLGEKGKIHPSEFQKIGRRDKKAILKEQWKEIEENNRMGKTRVLLKKTGVFKGLFHARMGMIKVRNGKDLMNKVKMKVSQSCPTLCDPMDCIVHGILQARTLEWVAVPFSRGSSQPRDQTQVSHISGGFFTSWTTRKASRRD